MKLRLVHRKDGGNGFYLYDYSVLNNHVDSIAGVDSEPVVNNWELHLGLNGESTTFKFVHDTRPICTFQQSWT